MTQLVAEAIANDPKSFWFEPIAANQFAEVFLDFSYSPVQFDLFGKIRDEWEMTKPLLVTLEQDEDGYYVLSDELFLMYGEGPTEIKAKEDYLETMVDYYQIIQEKAHEGDEPSQAILQKIQEYLRPTNQ
jgi:hypothetical protein